MQKTQKYFIMISCAFCDFHEFTGCTHTLCMHTQTAPVLISCTAYVLVKKMEKAPTGILAVSSGNQGGEAGLPSALLLFTKFLRCASTGEQKAPREKQRLSTGS